MKVAVVGATGMVGTVMLKVLSEQKFPVTTLIPVASERSIGKEITYEGNAYPIVSMQDAINAKPDIALFSAGGNTSLEWAPKFRIVVSTYQSITGTGVKAVRQLESEYAGEKGEMAYPYPIHRNALPHCDVFVENGYTKEEVKLVNETKKILDDNTIAITATAIRIPVVGGHSESVNVEFENDFDVDEVRKILHESPGIVVQDNPDVNVYPMPIYAEGKDDVFVGRIRRDGSQPNSLNMWIVSDNLRKGAATNAVQIAQHLVDHQLV